MSATVFSEILEGLYDNTIVPYLGPGVLFDAKNKQTGAAMPADSNSLILAMNNGNPMAPKLMYEFPRAAMNLELKRGRNFLGQFLTKLYGETEWTRAAVHDWLAEWQPRYVIDINRDSQLQDSYIAEQLEHLLIVGVARITASHFRFKIYQFDGTGAELVREVRGAGFEVVTIPGPSAVAAALSISGMPADRYIFLGFLPRRGKERSRLLQTAAESPVTVVMFESPQRTVDLLDDLVERCGPVRTAAIARELTKVHEELKSGTLTELATHYRERPVRGEVTVLLSGAATSEDEHASVDRMEEVRERARTLLAEGASRRDVAQIVARELRLSRNEAYRMVTAL